jgi:alpha-tubulin suppressor-like RCC1 family protein
LARRCVSLIVAALGLALGAGCGDSPLQTTVAPPAPGSETIVKILQGNGARLNPGSLDTIIIWVRDRSGSSREGARVTWSVTSGRGSVVPLDTVTISGGIARAIWTLGIEIGTDTLVVISETASATAIAESAQPLKAMSIAPGAQHACALTSDGMAYCWGDNRLRQLGVGQLGPGEPGDPTLDTYMELSKTPVRVKTTSTFSALASQAHHTCGLSLAGEAICWGMGYESGPTRVSELRFIALTTGMAHTCGLAADGAAYCWGDNESAQLGAGAATTSVPTRVTDAPPFVSIAAGGWYTCGLTADGRVFCWGSNELGQLGATAPDTCVVPQFDDNGTPLAPKFFACSRRAIETAVGARVAQISAGPSRVCAATIERTVVCWGGFAPGPYTVAGAEELTGVTQADQLACGLDAGGRAWCWSFPGGSPWYSRPEPLPGNITFATLSGGVSVLCGRSAQDSIAYCWGWDDRGQLGDGTTSKSYRALPTRVVSPAG